MSERRLQRLRYLADAGLQASMSLTTAAVTSDAAFMQRFPGFAQWQQQARSTASSAVVAEQP